MRLNNYRKESAYNFINTMVILGIFGGVFGFFINYKMKILPVSSFIFLLISALAAAVYYLAGRQFFEYDSDGEALNFKNKSKVPFLFKDASDEFPKYKLQNFEIINLPFFSRLYIFVSSKKSKSVKLKYDISYLTSKEKKDLKISLNKVLKANSATQNPENQS